MILKRITADQVAELTDSVIVSVGAEDPASVTASVSWMEEGDILADEGPLTVPDALTLAQTKADEMGKDTIYITLQPDTFKWLKEWGVLS
ncbi:hypothetical protein [Devosia sp. 2618]|uniref:hypothetical protein n=1 Tax=Devosia sp. 2618 TaxID=3156454 RepID=UPI003392DBEA